MNFKGWLMSLKLYFFNYSGFVRSYSLYSLSNQEHPVFVAAHKDYSRSVTTGAHQIAQAPPPPIQLSFLRGCSSPMLVDFIKDGQKRLWSGFPKRIRTQNNYKSTGLNTHTHKAKECIGMVQWLEHESPMLGFCIIYNQCVIGGSELT